MLSASSEDIVLKCFLNTECFFVNLQAIDPRTRMVLFKMLNRGTFSNINGCISTGKEVT